MRSLEIEVLNHNPTPIVSQSSSIAADRRPTIRGKFLYVGDEKFYICGATYGPFRPAEDGNPYHNPEFVGRDFTHMVANGINAVRVYTVPPRWFLDAAQQHHLLVMVGLPWEQHITFLNNRKRMQAIEEKVREGVRVCAGHPAVLCYVIGNEIPASIVRWHGRRRVEHFLARLYQAVKAEHPDSLVTYANYPTTEYLQLPFLDLVCFNVYLESQEAFAAYLARLQNIAGNRPLVLAEVGLDSRQQGEDAQAGVLDWQVRAAFAAGSAGVFVFAWTDEWHRGGHDIEDWDFGLTDRVRRPKPALATVGKAFAEVPFPHDLPWPSISVVVCSYNGSRTLRNCCEGLLQLDYPNREVIIVDDGSTDATPVIAREYGFRVISTKNQGLSSARNTGLQAATGEIIAYLDDDACPDPHWLTYLAATFMNTKYVGVGGPNITPPDEGFIATCVAKSPGNPTHILLTDHEAEHIPGCNMAFRKVALQAVGGFDTRFRIAGDDVDLCWRLQQCGGRLGFSPAAMVWHHRRNSVRAYWKQQLNYGRAEALLEMKWPEKYNQVGHLTWRGRLYGDDVTRDLLFRRWRIYYGVWGSGLFQSIYETAPDTLLSLPLMPEWYLVVAALLGLSMLGALWGPLLLALPLMILASGVPLAQATFSATHASFPQVSSSRVDQLKLRSLTAILHLLQPLARLHGRLHYGLPPWRQRRASSFAFPWLHTKTVWSEHWLAPQQRLTSLEALLRDKGVVVMPGGEFDGWDLEVRGGLCGALRVLMAIEEHGAGKQLIRFRSWPRIAPPALVLTLLFAILATGAAISQAWLTSALLGLVAILAIIRIYADCAVATTFYLNGVKSVEIGQT